MSYGFYDYTLPDVLIYFDVGSIMLIHQLCHYTNNVVLSRLSDLYIRDNIVDCKTYREYLLRVSMVNLTYMSRYVTSDVEYLMLQLRYGTKTLSSLTDHDKRLITPYKSFNYKQTTCSLIECINLGLKVKDLVSSPIVEIETMRQQAISGLMDEYHNWKDNEKVQLFIAKLCVSLFNRVFVEEYVNNRSNLLKILDVVKMGHYSVLRLITDIKISDIDDLVNGRLQQFINCVFDELCDNVIWEVLQYSHSWLQHISVRRAGAPLDKGYVNSVSYILICISKQQLDDVKHCLLHCNYDIRTSILHIILVKYKRIDLYKVLKINNDTLTWLNTNNYSLGEIELYVKITIVL